MKQSECVSWLLRWQTLFIHLCVNIKPSILLSGVRTYWWNQSVLDGFVLLDHLFKAALSQLWLPGLIMFWLHTTRGNFQHFTLHVLSCEGTLSQVGILGVDLLQFLPYNFVCTEASIGYEQIVNTGPHSAVNFILMVIHGGVHGQCLRLCSRVFALDVLPQFYFKQWIWLPLMVS